MSPPPNPSSAKLSGRTATLLLVTRVKAGPQQKEILMEMHRKCGETTRSEIGSALWGELVILVNL